MSSEQIVYTLACSEWAACDSLPHLLLPRHGGTRCHLRHRQASRRVHRHCFLHRCLRLRYQKVRPTTWAGRVDVLWAAATLPLKRLTTPRQHGTWLATITTTLPTSTAFAGRLRSRSVGREPRCCTCVCCLMSRTMAQLSEMRQTGDSETRVAGGSRTTRFLTWRGRRLRHQSSTVVRRAA